MWRERGQGREKGGGKERKRSEEGDTIFLTIFIVNNMNNSALYTYIQIISQM